MADSELLDVVVQAHVERVVALSRTRAEAARRLGVSRSTLYRYLLAFQGPTAARDARKRGG
jgi:DNA-binding phage protein